MINEWLNKLEEKLNSDYDEYYCGVATTLFTLGYPMDPTDVWCIDCDEDNQKLCKAKAQEIISKIREEWKWYRVELAHEIKLLLENKTSDKEEASEQTVEYINLDALDSLKYKLKEKYDVLFNKFEVTEFERGELDAFTQTLYMIDDIMEKQATSDKTSDKTSYIEEQMRELSRKPLHDAEAIARALKKVNNQSDKVNHPTHYKVHKHECIDEMVAVFGVEAVKCFCKCNAWKYRYRSSAKNGEEDLKKADWYLEKLIELEEIQNDKTDTMY